MKNILFVLLIILVSITTLQAQVPKKIIVEHFTNTNCGICASRNPGFYVNLNNQTDALHLAVHPSAPYPNCVLFQQNASDNDARTNYYSIYGSTPRIVVNGNVVSASTNYGSPAIFTPYQSLTSPASLRIEQEKFGTDSIRTTVIVKTESSHSLGALSLFICLAEDTVYYTGGNGEPKHYDVFRKALSPVSGIAMNLPAIVGDSLIYLFTTASNPIWNFSRIYSMAILQESGTKNVIQAEAVPASFNNVTTGITTFKDPISFQLYPNPTSETIQLESSSLPAVVSIFDLEGRFLQQEIIHQKNQTINLSPLAPGIYMLKLQNEIGTLSKKLIKNSIP